MNYTANQSMTMPDILFWFRKADYQPDEVPQGHPKEDVYGTIHCRVTVNKKRIEVGATGVRLWQSQWRNKQVMDTGKNQADTLLANLRLNQVRNDLQQSYMQLLVEKKPISAYAVKQLYLRTVVGGKPSIVTVAELLDAWITYEERRVKSGAIEKSSLEIRSRHVSHLKAYLASGRRAGLPAEEFTGGVIDDFRLWLLADAKKHEGYTYKILQSVKAAFIWAVDKSRLIAQNPINSYTIPTNRTEPDTTHLTEEQLKQLIYFNPYELVGETILKETADALDNERDSFVFGCFTGLHDGDYKNQHYRIEKKKQGYWLAGQREKTRTRFELPLDPVAVRIIDKYGGIENLPKISNVRRNARLKQLAILAQIPVHLTTKIARKTFADRMLNAMDYDPLDVAGMLGHKDLKHLKHYVRVRSERLFAKFKTLENEPGLTLEVARTLPSPFAGLQVFNQKD